jgi:putative salt-induced outer membrane protein YdiY
MLLLLSVFALAQEPEPVSEPPAPSPEPEPAAETRVTAEAGGAVATGNAQYTNVSGSLKADRTVGKSKVQGLLAGFYGRSAVDGNADGRIDSDEREAGMIENARNFSAEGRYDFLLRDRSSIYVLVGALHDRFAGYQLRSHEQLGCSQTLFENESTTLKAEAGVDAAQEFYVEGTDPSRDFPISAVVKLAMDQQLRETLAFSFKAEVYQNVLEIDDLRLLTETSLTSQLNGRLSLKLTHKLSFDNQPVENFQPVDQILTAGLVVTVF